MRLGGVIADFVVIITPLLSKQDHHVTHHGDYLVEADLISTEDQVQSAHLLDVVVRQSVTNLKLLVGRPVQSAGRGLDIQNNTNINNNNNKYANETHNFIVKIPKSFISQLDEHLFASINSHVFITKNTSLWTQSEKIVKTGQPHETQPRIRSWDGSQD